MNVAQFVEWLPRSEWAPQIAHWERRPARLPRYAEWPAGIDPRLVDALARRGISRPYVHQAAAFQASAAGRNVVVVTPTASGKTLCYNLPVLTAIARDPDARALYLFPTKALAQDQLAELQMLSDAASLDLKTFTYDGDTPPNARRAVRQAGQIVVTNPDMLHTGILPHHTGWRQLFSNLRYVVIDELHVYRGVFGSNVANVLRRLARVCAHYGATPQFIICSATIANPGDLAVRLIGQPVEVIDDNGAPASEKHVVFVNPPVVSRPLGIRAGSIPTARRLAGALLDNQISTIVFARSRLTVEVLLSHLQDDRLSHGLPATAIRGYRGGYLPNERRAIEHGLRSGEVRAVVATNALELGIDIGTLDACVMVGYPGTIASTWQQAGRSGRREGVSLAMLIASSSPLDQFIVAHPEYFFGASPEAGLVNPQNLYVLAGHVKSAAFELPFRDGEIFGDDPVAPLLRYLEDERLLYHSNERWYWTADSFPAQEVNLRTTVAENVVIVDQSDLNHPVVIGEMDRLSAATALHDEAIYLHATRQYEVVRLDWEELKAYVRPVEVDYYTDAGLSVRLAVLDEFEVARERSLFAWGEVSLTLLATIYKKIRLATFENVGWGKIRLPEDSFHTTAFWIAVDATTEQQLGRSAVEQGIGGLAFILGQLAPLYLMCDPRDIGVYPEARSAHTGAPTVFLYDAVPGGIGFSERLYKLRTMLLQAAHDLIRACPCDSGCPSCVGAPNDGEGSKATTLALLEIL